MRLEKPMRRICTSAEDVATIVRDWTRTAGGREVFVAISLDGRHRSIVLRTISVGTLTSSLVHPREVFRGAIEDGAAAIIVAHNHPSGECYSSQEDHDVTKRLVQAGKILGICVLDHVIVTSDSFYSFQSSGDLEG